jgi:hypothetical protein
MNKIWSDSEAGVNETGSRCRHCEKQVMDQWKGRAGLHTGIEGAKGRDLKRKSHKKRRDSRDASTKRWLPR